VTDILIDKASLDSSSEGGNKSESESGGSASVEDQEKHEEHEDHEDQDDEEKEM